VDAERGVIVALRSLVETQGIVLST